MSYTAFKRLGPEDLRAHHRQVGSVSPTCHHHKWAEIDALANRVQSFVQGEYFKSLLSTSLQSKNIQGADQDDFFIDKKVTVHMTGATLEVEIEGLAGRTGALSLTLLGEDGLNIHTDTSAIRRDVEMRSYYKTVNQEIISHDKEYRLPFLLPFMETVDQIFGPGRNLEASFGPTSTPTARQERLRETVREVAAVGSQPEGEEMVPKSQLDALQDEIRAVRQELAQEKVEKRHAETQFGHALGVIKEKDELISLLSAELERAKGRAQDAAGDLDTAKGQIRSLQKELETTRQKAQSRIDALEHENADLVSANKQLSQKLKSTQSLVQTLRAELAEVKEENEDLKRDLLLQMAKTHSAEGYLADSKERERVLEAELAAANARILELEPRVTQLDKDLTASKRRVQDLNVTDTAKDRKLAEASQREAQLREELETTSGQLEEIQGHHRDLSIQLLEVRKLNTTLQSELDRANADKEAIEVRLRESQDQLSAKEDELEAAGVQIRELKAQNAKLIEANMLLKAEADRSKATITELEKARASAVRIADEAQLAVQALRLEVDSNRKEIETLGQSAQDSASQDELEAVKRQLADKETLLAQAKERADTAAEVAEGLQAALETEKDNYSELIAELKALLKERTQERDEARINYEEEEAKVYQLSTTVSELKERIAQLERRPLAVSIQVEEDHTKNSAVGSEQDKLELEYFRSQLEQTEKELRASQITAQGLKVDLETKTAQISALEDENGSLSEQVTKLKQLQQNLKDAHALELEQLQAELNEEAIRYLQEASEANRKASHAKQRLEETELKLRKALSQIKELQENKSLASSLHDQQELRIKELEKAVTGLSGQRFISSEQAEALLQLRDNYLEIQGELEIAELERNEAVLKESATRKELSALSDQVGKLQTNAQRLEESLTSAHERLITAEKEAQDASTALRDLRTIKDRRINLLERDLDAMKSHVADYEDVAARSQAAHEQTTRKLSEALGEVKRLDEELSAMEALFNETPRNAADTIERLKQNISALQADKEDQNAIISGLQEEVKGRESEVRKFQTLLAQAKKELKAQSSAIALAKEDYEAILERMARTSEQAHKEKQSVISNLEAELQEQEQIFEAALDAKMQMIRAKDHKLIDFSRQIEELQATLDGRLQKILHSDELKELTPEKRVQLLQSEFEAAVQRHEIECEKLIKAQRDMKRAHEEALSHIQAETIEKFLKAIPEDLQGQITQRLNINGSRSQPVKA